MTAPRCKVDSALGDLHISALPIRSIYSYMLHSSEGTWLQFIGTATIQQSVKNLCSEINCNGLAFARAYMLKPVAFSPLSARPVSLTLPFPICIDVGCCNRNNKHRIKHLQKRPKDIPRIPNVSTDPYSSLSLPRG